MQGWSLRRRSLLPLAVGLGTAQAIAVCFVWRSNQALLGSAHAMQAAGWLTLPAGPAVALLGHFGSAFWGALFFTLSVGAGLTLAAWGLLYLWQRVFGGRRWMGWVLAGIWILLLAAVNADGGALFPTLFVAGVPLGTAAAAWRRASPEATGLLRGQWYWPLVALALLTGLWGTQLNRQLFTSIRDHLLLSNAVGRQVNDFYYRYTLFAARAFKSFDQKTLRTCRLGPGLSAAQRRTWENLLARYDVLSAPGAQPVDLSLQFSHGRLRLAAPDGAMIETTPMDFQRDPRSWLHRFSRAEDRYVPFRRLVLLGLLIGFPVLLFAAVDGVIGRMAGVMVTSRERIVKLRSILCLAIGVALFIPMLAVGPGRVPDGDLARQLSAPAWPRVVAALRQITRQKIDIARFPGYRALIESPRVVERYWLARALGASRSPDTYADLLRLTRDSHPNVVCQAYYALGERGNRSAVSVMERQMTQSDHWYTQWYAYRAMRRLGWHQTLPASTR